MGLLYVITDDFVIDNGIACKIGFTNFTVEDRIRRLQPGNPRTLREVVTWNFTGDGDNKSCEEKLHNHFRKSHIRGEWFALSAVDLEILSEIVKRYRNALAVNRIANSPIEFF